MAKTLVVVLEDGNHEIRIENIARASKQGKFGITLLTF